MDDQALSVQVTDQNLYRSGKKFQKEIIIDDLTLRNT
jgi:hypothetical protein